MMQLWQPRSWLTGTVAVLLLGAGLAGGQEANRLDFRLNEIGTGDANNQLGSGGFNQAPVPNFVANAADLYITGNVTGGRSFRAFSPVGDPLSFYAHLGSSGLDDFRRDSMSVTDVLAGRSPAVPMPYYSRQRTTTSWGTISAGFDQVTSWRTEGVYLLPDRSAVSTAPPFGAAYVPKMASSITPTLVGTGQLTVPLAERSPFLQPLPTLAGVKPATVAWFGLNAGRLSTAAVAGLVQEGPDLWLSSEAAEEVPLFDTAADSESVDLVERTGLSDWYAPGEVAEPGETGPEGELRAEAEAAAVSEASASLIGAAETASGLTPPRPMFQDPGAGPLALSEQPIPSLALTGADLYRDMVNAYLFATEVEQRGAEIRAALTATPAAAEAYERDLSVVRSMLDESIETFAGPADTPVQNLIRRAEDLVHQGQYYQAKALYERALIFDRANPLLLLGQGHAMLAAGEYYSAALKLSRAVELFHAMACLKFDLRTFITEPDLLEKRRADLEGQLEQREDYRFRFLLGYVEYYSDLAKYGLPNLKQAAEQAPEHSGVARLHELLIQSEKRDRSNYRPALGAGR